MQPSSRCGRCTNITATGNTVTLRWPGGTAPLFAIEKTTNLAPANWMVIQTNPMTNLTISITINDDAFSGCGRREGFRVTERPRRISREFCW